jgi:hypothetical protein
MIPLNLPGTFITFAPVTDTYRGLSALPENLTVIGRVSQVYCYPYTGRAPKIFRNFVSPIVQIFLDTFLNDTTAVRQYPVGIGAHKGDESLRKANAAPTGSGGPPCGDRLAERLYALQKPRC